MINYSTPDLTQHPPRSVRVRLGGYAHLARLLDKARAVIAHKGADYHYNCPLDQQLFAFVGITADAMLAEIKSRMLLPRSSELDEDEEDPRAQLIRRLQEYERFKKAAEDIEEMPRLERVDYRGGHGLNSKGSARGHARRLCRGLGSDATS